MRWRLLLVVTVVVTWSWPVLGGEASLLLVDPDPQLESAVRGTLRAWQTPVVVERIAGPGSTMPGSADRARRLARHRAAAAVVWISRSDEGFALWMYDAGDDRVVARALPSAPPFDAATAASVALAIKTLLRHSPVPPEHEQLQPASTNPRLSLAVLAGVCPNGTTLEHVEPRFGFGFTLWPSWWRDPWKVGLGLEGQLGLGVPVRHSALAGKLIESSLLLAPRAMRSFGESFDVAVTPAVGFSVTSLEGVLRGPRRDVGATRVSLLLAGYAEVGHSPVQRLRLALRFGVQVPRPRQSYFVDEKPILRVERARLACLLMVELFPL